MENFIVGFYVVLVYFVGFCFSYFYRFSNDARELYCYYLLFSIFFSARSFLNGELEKGYMHVFVCTIMETQNKNV